MARKKYYVVWKGRLPGIFENWDECKAQVHGFPDPEYKSFNSIEQAQQAFEGSSKDYIGNNRIVSELSPLKLELIGKPISESISVDGACNDVGLMEYQGVNTQTKERIFHLGPLKDGTNNIAEFLAIVHALALSKSKGSTLPIYSDSRNAIKWVRKKKANTKLEPTENNEKIFELITRAEQWLASNEYSNSILKWETTAWGENPADFGRK